MYARCRVGFEFRMVAFPCSLCIRECAADEVGFERFVLEPGGFVCVGVGKVFGFNIGI